MTPRGRRLLIGAVVAVVCIVLGLCVVLTTLLRPLASQTASAASEWSGRLSQDYPGWQQMSFNVGSFSGTSGEKRSTWTFGLVPPDRKFTVGVQYVSENGAPAVVQDETLRPSGRFHDRADSLLDYIEATHIKKGRSVTAVTGGADGAVTVNWIKVSQVGPFSSRIGSFEELTYDESSGSWRVSFSPPK